MIQCNFFEIRLLRLVDEFPQSVDFLCQTDLPEGTRLILSCQRRFTNTRGEECLWIGQDEELEISSDGSSDSNGCRGHIDVVNSDRKALDRFKQISSESSAGIASPVSDNLELVITVGARQPLKGFGKHNAFLCGRMVREDGGVKFVRETLNVNLPMDRQYQPPIC